MRLWRESSWSERNLLFFQEELNKKNGFWKNGDEKNLKTR